MSLSKILYPLLNSSGSTQEDLSLMTEKLLTGHKEDTHTQKKRQ